jgi:hypothetical protein
MKPKGKMSVRKAVEEIFPVLPHRFTTIFLHYMVSRRIGRPEVFHDTCLRKLREMRSEGLINFKNVDKLKSIYEKL